MRQKLTLITLGVSDLDKAITFFEQGLAWKRSPSSTENMVLFDLGGFGLALYPKKLLAEDANMPDNGSGFSGITLSFNAKNEAEVDQVLAEVSKIGGRIVKKAQKVFWGGYSGYFMDPDGHLIEVAYNPYWEMDEKGNLKIPPPKTSHAIIGNLKLCRNVDWWGRWDLNQTSWEISPQTPFYC